MDCGRALPVCLPVETGADQDLPIEHSERTKTVLQRDNAPGAVGKLRHRSCSFSSDGRYYAYGYARLLSELYMIKGLR